MNLSFLTTKRVLAAAVVLAFVGSAAAATPHYIFTVGAKTLKVDAQPAGDTVTPSGSQPSGSAPVASAPVVNLSTTTLSFGEVPVGGSSSLSVRLSNAGTAPLTFASVPQLIGSSVFSVSAPGGTNCASVLSPGAYCDTTVVFKPIDATASAGSLEFSSNAANSPAKVSLSGSGQPVRGSLAAAAGFSTNFGAQTVGTSATNNFAFTNTGTVPLTAVQASLSGSTDISFLSNTCGAPGSAVTLAPAATCSMSVRYLPSAGGTLTGTLSVASSATNGTQTLSLTGSSVGDPYWSTTNLLLAPFDTGYTDIASGRGGAANTGNAGYIGLTNAAGTSKAGSALALVNTAGKTGSLDANGNGVTIPASTAGNDVFAVGAGNFTVEGWYKWTSFVASKNTKCPSSIYIWTLAGSCNISWPVMAMNLGDTTGSSTTLSVALSSSAMPSSGPDIANWVAVTNVSLNTWYHIALVRNGTAFTVYINGAPTWSKTVAAGTAIGSVADTARWPGAGLGIGAGYRGQNYAGTNIMAGDGMTGYIDDFRFTKGVARYTSTFVPSAPAPQGK